MPAGRVVLLIALLIGLQPLSTDLYLPALPALTTGFGASMTQAQLTLTVLVLALGVSQLFWGPISDRFGRRPVLLVGMVAYALASVACAMAPSIGLLIFWRAVQGAAMGAGVVCGRAIVRDLYEPTEGARVMSKAMSGLAVIACTSPPLGGLLSDLFGWRVALTTLAVFGLVTLALVGVESGWALLLPQCLFMIGHGVHQPCGQSGAVGPFPQAAGAASAVNGFVTMLMAFAVGSWLGGYMDGSVLPLALGVWFWSAVTALVAWTLVRRHGQSGKR